MSNQPRAGISFNAQRSRHALVLATLASVALAIVTSHMSSQPALFYLDQSVHLATPWLIWIALSFSPDFQKRFDALYPLAPLAWAAAPLIGEVVMRQTGVGIAGEIVAIACLRNAAMATALYVHRPQCESISTLIGGFVVLFVTFIWPNAWMYSVSAVYLAVLLWWLMTAYWQRVQTTAQATAVQSTLPIRMLAFVIVPLACLAMLPLFGFGMNGTWALPGISFASGGSSQEDEFAQNGVGDGNAMVAAKENAMSFGPVESELFLDSDMPTLYDMFNDMYGEPPKPKKKQHRSVALKPGEVKEQTSPVAVSNRNGKEFSTIRRKTAARNNELQDRREAAMLYVIGEVPLHLAVERFDAFDGSQWKNTISKLPRSDFVVNDSGDKPWINIGSQLPTLLDRGVESHALKFINFKSNRVPAPPLLSAIHIHKLTSTDFFQRTPDDSLMMPHRDHIPQLTVMRLRSRKFNLTALREKHLDRSYATNARLSPFLKVAANADSLRETAEEWTHDSPGGYADVEAIVDRLRTGFTLEPDASVPEDYDNSVEWFLKTKRGPDFLFATTAAQMIRCKGYPTRLVSGFYASAQNYNYRSKQTSVLATDVHVWLEVCIDGETWIPLEPTPGYESPRETLNWKQQFAKVIFVLGEWFASRWLMCIAAIGAVGLLVWSRLVWVDWLLTLLLAVSRIGGERNRIQAILLLLEWRSRLAGRPRPRSTTFRQWYLEVGGRVSSELTVDLEWFLARAEQVLYSTEPRQLIAEHHAELATRCTSIATELTAFRINAAFRNENNRP